MRFLFSRSLLLTVASISLVACASTGTPQSVSSKSPYDAKINAALERAANQATKEGSGASSLALLERLYKRDPKNADNALKFARALRQAGDPQKSALVLAPFADRADATTDTLVEMATLHLSATKYAQAETAARKAISKDAAAFRAYQILGIALEGQNKYKDAETAFRQALDMWQGDPIPVMNNLALNLTNQERLDEALEIMERAKQAAPNRVEVERNLRIIRTLNESAAGRPAPKPADKPPVKPVTAAKAATSPTPAAQASMLEPAAGGMSKPVGTPLMSTPQRTDPGVKHLEAKKAAVQADPALAKTAAPTRQGAPADVLKGK